MKPPVLIFLLFFFPLAGMAQSVFLVTNGSAKYTAKITVAKCAPDLCSGKAQIQLLDKEKNRPVQTLTSPDLYFALDSSIQDEKGKAAIAGDQHPLIFDDFNFKSGGGDRRCFPRR